MRASKGTTLLEALVYIGLLGGLFTVIVSVLISSSTVLQEIHAMRAINQSGLLVVERIGEAVRSGTELDTATSTFGVDPSILGVIENRDGNATSTVFYVVNGAMYLYDETDSIRLTDDAVTVDSFVVENISIGSTTAVKIDMTIGYMNGSSTRSENFYGTFNARGAYDER